MTGHGFDSNARKTSSALAFVVFFKSLFGAGLLALPNVIGRVGLVLAAVIYLSVALGCSFSCYLLLRAREITADFLEKPKVFGVALGTSNDNYVRQPNREGGQIDKADRPHHLVTYGDLADVLLGKNMATVTRWTIIVLTILFTAGLVIVIIENLESFASSHNDGNADDFGTIYMSTRQKLGLVLFLLVSGLVQIPWLQDMWIISMIGLAVYTIGVIGSSLFSALWTIFFGEASGRGMPTDLWEFKWPNVPAFTGNAVYALEGIFLALPTVHAMQHPSDATHVVCGALVLYGVITLIFAIVAYAGGLGGGDGTGLETGVCDVVTNCITPPALQSTIQITLGFAMLLGIPIMLFPATEMLEVMLTDRLEKKEQEHIEWRKRNALDTGGVELLERTRRDSETNLVQSHGASERAVVYTDGQISVAQQQQEFSQDRSWKLRLFLSFLTVMLGTCMKSFTQFSGFVGAVGLSFAGFVLPPLLFFRAHQAANMPVSYPMRTGAALLAIFGIYNMIAGGLAAMM